PGRRDCASSRGIRPVGLVATSLMLSPNPLASRRRTFLGGTSRGSMRKRMQFEQIMYHQDRVRPDSMVFLFGPECECSNHVKPTVSGQGHDRCTRTALSPSGSVPR